MPRLPAWLVSRRACPTARMSQPGSPTFLPRLSSSCRSACAHRGEATNSRAWSRLMSRSLFLGKPADVISGRFPTSYAAKNWPVGVLGMVLGCAWLCLIVPGQAWMSLEWTSARGSIRPPNDPTEQPINGHSVSRHSLSASARRPSSSRRLPLALIPCSSSSSATWTIE